MSSMEPVLRSDARPDAERARRKWKRLLVLGVVLSLGPIFGILGAAYALRIIFRQVGSMPAATPADVAAATNRGILYAASGTLAGPFGVFLIVWSYTKLRRRERAPAGGAWK